MSEPPVIAATYSKRAPLACISGNLPVQVRQSNRLHVVASAENPSDLKQSGPKSEEGFKSFNVEGRYQPGAVDSTTDLESKSNKRVSPCPAEMPLTILEKEETDEIRIKRVPKLRVPFNVPRVKKKLTLAEHIKKYGPTHDIELCAGTK